MGYSDYTKVVIYVDPKTRFINRTFSCYIDKYDIELYPKKSMSFVALVIQEYPYGVYQTGTPSPDPNIHLNQTSLDTAGSTFASSDLLNLELLLPPSGTPMKTTILDYPISYILYICQVPSTLPIIYQFPMVTHRNIYMLVIYNEQTSLPSTYFQLFWEKQKRYISSSAILNLA